MSSSLPRADLIPPGSFTYMGHVRLAAVRLRVVEVDPGRGASRGQDTGQIRVCWSRAEV
jgi:hypothetical protein